MLETVCSLALLSITHILRGVSKIGECYSMGQYKKKADQLASSADLDQHCFQKKLQNLQNAMHTVCLIGQIG